MSGAQWVSVTTDYGTRDGFVASVHGVIARLAPSARVLDVTHEIPPGDVRWGSVVLSDTVRYLPTGIHLAVVDPGVGTARREVAVVAARGLLVGPDNGLLIGPADALGGVLAAFELADPAYRLSEVSRTFHGRDIFAPAAAHLANGLDPHLLGPSLDPSTLVRLPEPVLEVAAGRLRAQVLGADRFGNVSLAARAADLAAAELTAGSPVALRWGPDGHDRAVVGETFADAAPGGLLVLVDSAGRVAIARRDGSAASSLGLAAGAEVELRRRADRSVSGSLPAATSSG